MRLPKLAFILAITFSASSISTLHAIAAQNGNGSADLEAEIVNKALNKSQFKGIHVSVDGGIATLTGAVNLFEYKEDADRRVHHVKGVRGVQNNVEVAGPEIPDMQLQQKLVKAISYDRVGYGTTAFNAIGVQVEHGAVALSGHAYGPVDADSAVAVAANTPGVKDVTNDIQVDPASPMDDSIRLRVYRSVYGFPSLTKYAGDPQQPIRISVQNGNVTLYGVVDNKTDSDVAYIRANSVPGVFKVTNNLQVAGALAKE